MMSNGVIVLARISWGKLVLVFYGPLAALGVGWLALSSREIGDVFSFSNFTKTNGLISSPILGLFCLVFYLGAIVYVTWSQLAAGGRYLWVDGNTFRCGMKVIGNLHEIDPNSIAIKFGFANKILKFESIHGRETSIPLTVARYRGDLAENLRSIILDVR